MSTLSDLFNQPLQSPRASVGDPLMHRHATPAEASAAKKIRPICKHLRARVLDWYQAAGDAGLTAPEAGARYAAESGEPPSARREYSVRPRITELRAGGYLIARGPERDGATVYYFTGKIGDGADCPKPEPKAADRREALAEIACDLMLKLFAANARALVRAGAEVAQSRGEDAENGEKLALELVQRFREATGQPLTGETVDDRDARLPPGIIRLGRGPGMIAERKDTGHYVFIPGEVDPDTLTKFCRGGIEFDPVFEVS